MTPPATPPPRLSMILAREAPVAVIFRRGPSKHVEIVRWNTGTDEFERGHWFEGRIHDRRSDLSPDGELLVYFAARYGPRRGRSADDLYAWTAVSRVPWLTALALWPKEDSWWGGGLFTGRRDLWLNHPPDAAAALPDKRPAGLQVETNPDAHGEDEPVYARRLDREGWVRRHEWSVEASAAGFRTIVPEVRVRTGQGAAAGLSVVMERSIDATRYRERFSVEGARQPVELPPGPVSWVDWDARGRLVALAGGRVWAAAVEEGVVARFAMLLDLRDDRPERRAPPEHASRW